MKAKLNRELRFAYLAFREEDPVRVAVLCEIRGKATLAFELGLLTEGEWDEVVAKTLAPGALAP